MHEPLKLEQLVELKDEYTDVYPLSVTGARGIVIAKREMPQKDAEVYIEWDKEHWRYHGEGDGWTYEHHFRPVTDMIPSQPDMREMLAGTDRAPHTAPDACPHCGGVHDDGEEFLNTLLDAQQTAIDSEAYLILTLTPRDQNGHTLFEPEIFFESLSDRARDMLEAQIMQIGAELFTRDVMARVNRLQKGNG